MTTEYSFRLKRRLSEADVQSLCVESLPMLRALIDRYGEKLPLEERAAQDPMALDFLRTNWLLDERADKPSAATVTEALWPSFGRVLAHQLGMIWCEIEDSFGACISMLYFPRDVSNSYQSISVPPQSYVKKRESLQNSDVFVDAVKHLKEQCSPGGKSTLR